MRGANGSVGFIVDITGLLGIVFALVFLLAYGFDAGWKLAIGLAVIALLIGFIYGCISGVLWGAIFRSTDSLEVWMLSTIAIWSLILVLASKVSWFGLV